MRRTMRMAKRVSTKHRNSFARSRPNSRLFIYRSFDPTPALQARKLKCCDDRLLAIVLHRTLS